MKKSWRIVKNRPLCICDPPTALDSEKAIEGVCQYEYCIEFRCATCNGHIVSWGPAGCRCHGYIRWMFNRDMAPASRPAAVKPSISKQHRHRGYR